MLSMLSQVPSHVHGRLGSRDHSRTISWASNNEDSFAESVAGSDTDGHASRTTAAATAATTAAAAALSTEMVEIRSAGPALGDGLFATRAIAPGTAIFAEAPVFVVTTTSPPPTAGASDAAAAAAAASPALFCAALRGLPRDRLREIDALPCNPALAADPELRKRVREWYRDAHAGSGSGGGSGGGEPLKGKRLQDAAKPTVRRFAIFLTNRVPIEVPPSPSPTTQEQGTTATTTTTTTTNNNNNNKQQLGGGGNIANALFPLYSRVNHSCTPNVRRSWDGAAGALTVYACREIRAGEQVVASYVPYACRTREQRALDLQAGGWGFACGCAACADAEADAMRLRAHDLSRGLGHWANPLTRMIHARIPYLSSYLPTTTAEALAYAEELAELLERQMLFGPELCKVYREASKYSLETGSIQKALDYAYKEVDLGRCIVGTDSEYLGKEAPDADSWVKHLQKERFRKLRQFWERGRVV